MCMGNMIMEYRAVLENLEISQFAQLLQKAKKIAQLVRLSSDRPKEQRSMPQGMAVSTSEMKKKSDGRSTRSSRRYRVHQKSQMCSQINGLQMGSSSPIKFPENPLRKSRGTHIFVVCTIICNTLLQNAGHSTDQCTAESERELLSCPSQKCKETHSRTTRKRGQQQSLFAQIQEKTKWKGRPCLSQPLSF